MCARRTRVGAVHLRACAPSTSGVVRCVLEKNAAGVSIWRKEPNRELAVAGPARLELLCHTRTHTLPGLPHLGAPPCARGQPFLVPVRSRSQPLISSSPGGEAVLNARLLRRAHRIMKSCTASVAKISHHPDTREQLNPVNGGHRMLIHPSPGCVSVRLQLCPRPRPREPASRHLLLPAHYVQRRLPHHAHHPASCKVAPLFSTLSARQEGPGPPLSSQVASSRLPKTACQS